MSRPIGAERRQRFLLPPALDEWVTDDDPVRFIAAFVDSVDLGAEGVQMPDVFGRGAPGYAPELLLSVWLYGYVRRVRSTRQLEEACRERMTFRWLTGNVTPDHNAFWRFFKVNRSLFKKLFKKLLRVAAEQNLVSMVVHALDGTKLTAASSRRTAWHKDDLLDALKTMGADAIEQAIAEIEKTHSAEEGQPPATLPAELLDAKLRADAIKASLAKLAAEDREHMHPNEPDARIMQSNGRTMFGYNAQVVADDSGMIVAQEVVTDENDSAQLSPMLDQVHQDLGATADTTLADSGYESTTQLAAAQAAGRHVLGAVKPSLVDPPADKPYDKAHFIYDAERDVYRCPRGVDLPHAGVRQEKGRVALQVYRCHEQHCPVRTECSKDKNGRTVRRTLDDPALLAQREKMRDPDHRSTYALRQQIIEIVFARIKWIDGFTRFTVRGLEKVRAQFSLVCLARNLRLLVPAWQRGELRLAA